MKTYRGFRHAQGAAFVEVDGRELDLRLDLDDHSPTGFEWGYGGSGPAQLALALIADATGDDQRALKRHQQFKWACTARLPHDGWTLTSAEIIARLTDLENANADTD